MKRIRTPEQAARHREQEKSRYHSLTPEKQAKLIEYRRDYYQRNKAVIRAKQNEIKNKGIQRKDTVPILDRDTCLYLAGLFDGEGSFMIGIEHWPNGAIKYNVRVQIGMTHRETIEWVAAKLNRRVVNHKISTRTRHGERAKQIFAVKIYNGAAVISLIEQIIPFMITRRRPAELILEFCRSRVGVSNLPWQDRSYTEQQTALVQELRSVNRFGKAG